MQDGDFVHLRVHTAYSLSEGAIRIKDLAKLCIEQAMPAVAITDTNNLFGGMEFSSSMRQAGVQPIIGCQLSMTLTQATLRQGEEGGRPRRAGRGRRPGAERAGLRQSLCGYWRSPMERKRNPTRGCRSAACARTPMGSSS